MKFKLSSLKTIVLTTAINSTRLSKLNDTLGDKLNLTTYYGKIIPGYLGCALSTVELYKTLNPPVLVLEDDCGITAHYNDNIDVPDNADAVYLGTSSWGARNGISEWANSELIPYNDNFYKLNGMTSAHAILFLNSNFLNHLNKIGESYNEESPMPFDYLIAQEQHKFNVYGVAEPLFFQKDSGNENVTLFSLNNLYKHQHP